MAAIVTVWSATDATGQLRSALNELGLPECQDVTATAFCSSSPNEMFQWLNSAEEWVTIGKVLLGAFGVGWATQIGKELATANVQALKQLKLSDLAKRAYGLFEPFVTAAREGLLASIAVPAPALAERNAALVLNTESLATFCSQLEAFARLAPAIHLIVNDRALNNGGCVLGLGGRNRDMSIAVHFVDGCIEIPLTCGYPSREDSTWVTKHCRLRVPND